MGTRAQAVRRRSRAPGTSCVRLAPGPKRCSLPLLPASGEWRRRRSPPRISVLTHAASGRSATYGSLAAAAAKLPVPAVADLKLKSRAEYRLFGKRYRGVDDPKVVTGQNLFGIDVQVPGMVYATYTKCPAAGGKVRSFNVAEIKAQPGVLDAFALDGTGMVIEVMPGVAIIARDTWSAFQAKDKLKVDWDLGEASTDSQRRSPLMRERWRPISRQSGAPMSAMWTRPSPTLLRPLRPITTIPSPLMRRWNP